MDTCPTVSGGRGILFRGILSMVVLTGEINQERCKSTFTMPVCWVQTAPSIPSGSLQALCVKRHFGSQYVTKTHGSKKVNRLFGSYYVANTHGSEIEEDEHRMILLSLQMCLDAGPTASGLLTLQPCTTSLSQQFYLNNRARVTNCASPLYNYYTIQAVSTLQCMTVNSSSPFSGAYMAFSSCVSPPSPQQTFFLDCTPRH